MLALLTALSILPAGAAGATAERPDGRLYLRLVHQEAIVIVHPSGRAEFRAMPDLAPGDPLFNLVRVGRRLVFYGRSALGKPAVFSVDLDLRTPRMLAEAYSFFPSARKGRVWLLTSATATPGRLPVSRAQETNVSGGYTGPAFDLPRSPPSPVAATGAGLLLQRDHRLDLWDPRTQTIALRLPGPFPVATRNDMVVICQRGCPELLIANAATGSISRIAPPGGASFEETYGGAFSPDGALLAVPTRMRVGARGSPQRRIVALVDIRRQRARILAGARLSANYSPMGWSSSGRWLYFAAPRGRIGAYRRGSEGPLLLRARISDPFVSLVAE